MNTTDYHLPVLPTEIVEALQPASGKVFIDCTLGGGGHTQMLLDAGATVLGLDQDQDAIDHVSQKLSSYDQLTLVKTNFSDLLATAQANKFTQVDGILFDLGVSSHQLDEIDRGFSFQGEAELDMRMDQNLAVKAKDLLAALGEKELTKLFLTYGGESKAKHIARKIVAIRKTKPIETTIQLAELIESIKPRRPDSSIHPATKVFQALRIAVNDELNSVKEALPQAIELLKPGGTLAVISFHEGEDRIIKHYFKDLAQKKVIELVTPKPITPAETEIKQNSRSRSSKLRVAKKLNHEQNPANPTRHSGH